MTQRPKAEIVHAVEDYYDGPESGYANYLGHPHRFEVESEWTVRDRTMRRFRLTPIKPETLALVLKQQQLWSRWNIQNRQGILPTESPYPERVLLGDLEEYRSLETLKAVNISKNDGPAIRADGRFFSGRRVTKYGAFCESLRVVWSRHRAAA